MPTCTNVNTALLAYPCLTGKVLSQHERDALRIWFMASELAINGGTDYTSALATTLLTAADTYVQLATDPQLETVELAIHAANATSSGATLSTNYDTLMGSIAPLAKASPAQLRDITLYLLCALGAHQNPPA